MSEILSSPYTYAIIIALAAFLAAFGSSRINRQRNEIYKTTKEIVDTAKITLDELKIAGDSINKSLKEAKEANSKLQENKDKIIETLNKTIENKETTLKAQERIIGILTGGDSFPTILFDKKGFFLASFGEYGIPNLQLQIIHISNYQNCPIESLSLYLNENEIDDNIKIVYDKSFTKTFAGTIDLISFSDLDVVLDKNKSHAFDFNFNSDLKRWTQRIRLFPVNGRWEVLNGLEEEISYREKKDQIPSPKTIHFKASINFPFLQEIDGKKYARNALYYHLTSERQNKLNYYNLFNRSFEIKGENEMESFDIDYFEMK